MQSFFFLSPLSNLWFTDTRQSLRNVTFKSFSVLKWLQDWRYLQLATKTPGALKPVSDWMGEGTYSCSGALCIDQGSQWIATFTAETTNHMSSPEVAEGLLKGQALIKPWEGPLGEGLLGWLMRWILNRTHSHTRKQLAQWWARNNQSRHGAEGARSHLPPPR